MGVFLLFMKRIPTIMFPEVLDSLESLSNEEIGQMMRLIIKWNKGEVVEPKDSLEKFVWATIYPKLEQDKEKYLETCEKRRQAVNKRWSKEKDTNEYKSIQENTNSNYNYNNTSKEVLFKDQEDGKHEPLDGGSVSEEPVSKGLESLEKIFPPRKNDIGIDEINLWNSLSQQNKKTMIQRASMYIRNENKMDEGKFIKKIGKWMREQIEKGFEESMPSMKNSTSSTDPRLLKLVDGQVYSTILNKVSDSTGKADKIYNQLNRKDIFNDKKELLNFVQSMDNQEINNLLN